MRGAVGAGMVAAVRYIGLHHAFDTIYGTSAGAIVGAYFLADQVPLFGSRIYYDALCAPDTRFIDLRRFRHHPYFGRTTSPDARPVLHLDVLVDAILSETHPLDWNAFAKRQQSMPLVAIASSLCGLNAVALHDFQSISDLQHALRASARVPGIAGPPVLRHGDLLADGLLVEPIPFKSARAAGCSHALALCTRPAPTLRLKRAGVYEHVVARPHILGMPGLGETQREKLWEHVSRGTHHQVYNADVKRLREGNNRIGVDVGFECFAIAPSAKRPRVGQLETRARVVFDGVRAGFAAAYDALSPFAVDDGLGESSGERIAQLLFSDEEIDGVERAHKTMRRRRRQQRRVARRTRVSSGVGSGGTLDLSTLTELYLVG